MAHTRHSRPLGPGGTYKTGQRVPFAGYWTDQFGVTTFHESGTTFPPCIWRKGTCAYRHPHVKAAGTA